jgi:hypothetical protein
MHIFKIIVVPIYNALAVFNVYQHPAGMPAKPGLVQYQTGMGYVTMTSNDSSKLPGIGSWIIKYAGWFAGYENSVLRGAPSRFRLRYPIIYYPIIAIIYLAIYIKLAITPNTTTSWSLAYYWFIRKIGA